MLRKLSWDVRPVELEGFPAAQRRWLEHWAFAMLRKDHRFAEWMVFGLCLLGVGPGYWAAITIAAWLGFYISDVTVAMICWLGGCFVGGGIGGWLGRQWLLRRIRPYLRRMT